MKIKDFGQVFTPEAIVNDILDVSGYTGDSVLNKHVIDNSCGDGAFLIAFVKRYIDAYLEKNNTLEGINADLEKYIHGIELDEKIYDECMNNLNKLVSNYDIPSVKWDIVNNDALKVNKYNGKMDYVIGNPPYVRVHNLNHQYDNVKKYAFCSSGMTDLYIVFYELGLKMLNKNGVLCYITPNSFYNSLAGNQLRKYIKENRNMELIMDLGHYQPFSVTTYTTICKICNNKEYDKCKYYKYSLDTGRPEYICDIQYNDLFIDDKIVLSSNNNKYYKYLNYELKKQPLVEVKNAFATLNDKIFIQKEFEFEENIIDVIKASTGSWKKCIFPYDKNGNLIPFENLSLKVQEYFLQNKNNLLKPNSKIDSKWYAFGRSQAIKDVSKKKISINITIKDIESIKLNKVKAGQGIYSGLYMLTDVPFNIIKEKICSDDFIEYLKVVNKCKSGGYFTFSSKDLAKYINCCLEEECIDE